MIYKVIVDGQIKLITYNEQEAREEFKQAIKEYNQVTFYKEVSK